MKVLAVGLARVIWIFDIRFLNPRGLSFQEVFRKLGERYRFAKSPQNQLDFNEQKAWAFESGTFANSQKKFLNITFSIYNDGLVADTLSSTDDSTEFLMEVTSWAVKEFGFSIPPREKLKKGYLSQIDVESDLSLISLNTKLAKFVRIIESRVKTVDGKRRQFEMGSLNFWTEDVQTPMAPAAFRFERKHGVPFASNQYFSQAALETDEHIKLIQELEKLLKS